MDEKQIALPQEEPEQVKPLDLLYVVFFVGILLTFALYVCVTMFLGAQTSISDSYWTEEEYLMPMESYNEAYYKNDSLRELILRYDYGLFGKVNDNNVLVGRENFLFEVAREDNNYNYLRDYIGEFAFEQESLDNIYNYLKLRQTAYHNQGVEYMIVVIPNAQTAYQEYLPQYIQSAAGKTRLAQLSEYMRSKDDITFINLTDAMRAAKTYGVLYNNTEDSLNSLGQYFVYQSLYKALPENIKAGTKMVEFEDVTLYTHFTDGKTLAKTAGVSSVVKNETISLSNSMEFNYLLQELYPNIEITYADHNLGSANAGQTILLEFSNEWDKIQLMPYFSTSFDDVVYKSNHNFSLLTVDTAQPTLVIQFIHEYELSSLTNSNIAQTYHDGLTAGENPFTTSVPEVTGHVWLDDQTVCLTGLIEEGASLTVSGDAADVRTLRVGNNRFFARIEMGDLEEVVVRLQAASEDKNRSKVLKVTLTRGEQEIKPIEEITVGSDSRLFVTQNDYAILPDIGTLSVLEAELRQFSEHIQNRSSLKKTELIHVVIPQSYAVYADCAPESVQESLKMAGEHRNLMSGLYGACGWTVLDLTEPLQRERGIGKLYELTKDRWTDYGAYVGYKTLMSHIRKSYPQITPMSLDSYARVSQITAGGELAAMLGFDAATTTETNVHLLVNAPEVSYVQSGAGELDLKGAFTTMVENSALPIAVVLRDEAGTEMLESMARHFRIMIVLPEGETEINNQVLTLFEPDYIIRISKETTPGLYDLGNKDPE